MALATPRVTPEPIDHGAGGACQEHLHRDALAEIDVRRCHDDPHAADAEQPVHPILAPEHGPRPGRLG
jgi:hypothetical protein